MLYHWVPAMAASIWQEYKYPCRGSAFFHWKLRPCVTISRDPTIGIVISSTQVIRKCRPSAIALPMLPEVPVLPQATMCRMTKTSVLRRGLAVRRATSRSSLPIHHTRPLILQASRNLPDSTFIGMRLVDPEIVKSLNVETKGLQMLPPLLRYQMIRLQLT